MTILMGCSRPSWFRLLERFRWWRAKRYALSVGCDPMEGTLEDTLGTVSIAVTNRERLPHH